MFPPIRIVLSDDCLHFRELVRVVLTGEPGLKLVGEASDGVETITMVADLKPDVVLMDISMPRLNGLEATREIRTRWPHIPIVILTAHAHQYLVPSLRAGGSAYVLKETTATELIVALRSVTAGVPYISPLLVNRVKPEILQARPVGSERTRRS